MRPALCWNFRTLPALARFFSAFIVRCRDSPSHLEHPSPLKPRAMSAPFYIRSLGHGLAKRSADRGQVESPRGCHGLLRFLRLVNSWPVVHTGFIGAAEGLRRNTE